ncbi:MAG: hypothetical protein A2X84_08965 [Desulfuromonadaceae bacterium GWC2_58_13]|nr:MAG: hypothetical protein A2X84_08965 [Desulfuromonadaceae bacterium GWC2_58_13]
MKETQEMASPKDRQAWFVGLRTRLTVGFCLVFIVALVLVQLASIFGLPFTTFDGRMGEARSKAFHELDLMADGKRDFLLFWLNERRAAVNFIAANDFVEDGVANLLALQASLETTADPWSILQREPASLSLVEFFNKIRFAYGFYTSIEIASAETGKIFVSTDPTHLGRDLSASASFKESMRAHGGYVSDMERVAEDGGPVFFFSDVVKDRQGSNSAVLVLQVNADKALAPMFSSGVGIGDRGEALLVNRQVELLTNLKHPLPDGSRARPLEYRVQSEPAVLAARGENGVMEAVDYRGGRVLAAYRSLPVTPEWSWGLVVKTDRDELYAPLYGDMENTALFALAGSLFVILFTSLVAGLITRPVLVLSRAARQLAAGDRSVRCPVVLHDEIGVLSTSFNRMAETIETTMDGLEQQAVELRTTARALEVRHQVQQQALTVSAELAAADSLDALLDHSLRELMQIARAQVGAVYLRMEDGCFQLACVRGAAPDAALPKCIKPGEGGLGWSAESRSVEILENIPAQTRYLIRTVIGESLPNCVMHVPLVFRERTVGILALASLYPVTAEQVEVVEMVRAQMATAVINALAHAETERLAVDLQVKNEELASMNEELQSQSEELQSQAEELQGQSEELHAQTAELIAQQRLVEEADKLKSEFLSNMSHELRTPLNSIMALSQLMISRGPGKDPTQEAEYLQVIERNGRQLLKLINDILDLSKIEAGRIDMFASEFAPGLLAERAVDTIRPLAEKKGLALNLRIDKLPVIFADEDKVNQILLNLLSNAVKFTDRGEIEVTVSRTGSWGVAFAVRDTGIGIASGNIHKIFDEFRQVDGSTTRRHEGTGLGLAICRKLSRLLGGEIEVRSAEGQGSTFTLVLPLGGEGPPPRTASARREPLVPGERPLEKQPVLPAQRLSNPGRPRILVVEDNPVAALQIRSVLEESGYTVHSAAGGEEGLAFVGHTIPDGIVLDLMMPDVDGFEVLEQIRSTPTTATLPVLVLTAKELTAADRARLSHNNIQQLVQKGSLDRGQLLDCVGKLLKGHPEPAPWILIVEDNPDNRLTLEALLQEQGYAYLTVTDGLQAVQAVREKKPSLVLMDIHLPVLSGLDATRRIKSDPELKQIPVIALTARAMKGDREGFLAAGCDDYLAKPIDPPALRQMIDRWLTAPSGG